MTEYMTDYISLTANGFEISVLTITATLKISFLLLFVFFICHLFRSFSAATRHLLLMLAGGGVQNPRDPEIIFDRQKWCNRVYL